MSHSLDPNHHLDVSARATDPVRRHLLRSSLSVAMLGLASSMLAGCGGDDAGSEAAPDTAPGTPPATTPSPPAAPEVSAPTLMGRAVLPADSFVPGPTSGQFISGSDLDRARNVYGYTLPFTGKQPMQGFSAIIAGPKPGVFYVLQDNGFGGKGASPDALLHIYAMSFDWVNGKVIPANFQTGAPLASFTPESYIRLSDPDRRLGYPIVADMVNYPGTTASPAGQTVAVDSMITSGRLLTGYDIDPESMELDADGNLWIGEELGPFMLKFDRQGKLLAREIQMPNLLRIGTNPLAQSPNNPYLGGNTSGVNIQNSGGLESLAINASRTRLYGMYEKEFTGDDVRDRIISVFNLGTSNFETSYRYRYRVSVGERINGNGDLETEIYSVNDMVAINDQEFLVVEKDGGAGDVRTGKFAASGTYRNAARFKRVFKIKLDATDADGYLLKEEVVDLMNVLDPMKIGGADTIAGVFTYPMEGVEAVVIVDSRTLLLVNDNNYPGGSPSRNPARVDSNEFVMIRLPKPLALPKA